jgi:hypothetical protein
VLRPANGEIITAVAVCAAGEQATGGGVLVDISEPGNAGQFHMQQSGPLPGDPPSGWFGQVAPTTRFMQGSTLTLTVSALCVPLP